MLNAVVLSKVIFLVLISTFPATVLGATQTTSKTESLKKEKANTVPTFSSVKLSKTFSLSWPSQLGEKPVFLARLNAFYKTAPVEDGVSILIRREKPRFTGNQFSIERLWKTNLKNVKTMEMSSKDHGCKSISAMMHYCTRNGKSLDGKNFAERVWWNGKEDLVYIRTSGKTAELESIIVLNSLIGKSILLQEKNSSDRNPSSVKNIPNGQAIPTAFNERAIQ